MSEFTAKAAGGTVSIQAEADLRGNEPAYSGSVEVAQVSAGEFTRPFWDDSWGALTGTLALQFDFSGRGTQAVLLRRNITGNGVIELESGRFSGSPLMKTLAAFTGVSELSDLKLMDSGGPFSVGEGKFYTEKMVLGDDKRRVVLVGDASLEGALDIEALVGTAPGSGPPVSLDAGLVTVLGAGDGWSELPVGVVGTFDHPRPSFPDRALTAKARELLPDELMRQLGTDAGAGQGSRPLSAEPAVEGVRSVLEELGGFLKGSSE